MYHRLVKSSDNFFKYSLTTGCPKNSTQLCTSAAQSSSQIYEQIMLSLIEKASTLAPFDTLFLKIEQNLTVL